MNNHEVFQDILRGVEAAVMVALIIFFAVGFFKLGFSFEEILVIFGMPLVVGVVASYAIF